MTKEEAIEILIKEYKKGNGHAYTDFCRSYAGCNDCPLQGAEVCRHIVFNSLIERLIKAEEHQETNLEHYIDGYRVPLKDGDVPIIYFKDGWYEKFNAQDESLRKWVLSPYEPPRYKLSRFEYDLLECYHTTSEYGIKAFWILERMQSKGYFKGIPTDVPIRDILENCEVVD